MGTGVIDHRREVREEAQFLGPIVAGVQSSQLAYKFQDDLETVRNAGKDRVFYYSRGETFTTISPGKPGRFHGYHNLDKENPVALRIRKTIS